MRQSKTLIGLLVTLGAMVLGSSAQQARVEAPLARVYEGLIRPQSAQIAVDLGEKTTGVNFHFELENASDQPVEEPVGFAPLRMQTIKPLAPIQVAPRAVARIQEKHVYAVIGDKLKSVRIDPGLELGGKHLAARFPRLTIQVKLPAGVEQLVYSSLSNAKVSRDPSDGRKVLTYSLANQYLLPIVVKWNADVQLEVTKTLTRRGNNADVQVTIKNVGSGSVTDAVVSDTFHPGFVTAGSPQAEFQLVEGRENDRRLVWTRRVASLAPGQSTTLSYQIQFRIVPPLGLKLEATTVSRGKDHELIGASAPVVVAQ